MAAAQEREARWQAVTAQLFEQVQAARRQAAGAAGVTSADAVADTVVSNAPPLSAHSTAAPLGVTAPVSPARM
ncbi:MAG: hypothetical protein ACK4ZJ_19400, partial [Allorhizobium sp.]